MASPQLENGYTKIANELLEVVARTPLSGREVRVLLFVLRKTYGFKKKKDRISLSQLVKGTFMDRTSVCRMVNKLVASRTLLKENGVYSINKNYEQWVVARRPPQWRRGQLGSGVEDNLGSGVEATYKRKRPQKKETTKERAQNQKNSALIKIFFPINPMIESQSGDPEEVKSFLRLMETLGEEKLLKTISFIQESNGEPYAPVITTPLQLEKKLAMLVSFSRRRKKDQIKSKNYVL